MKENWGKHTSSTPASFSCRKTKLALQSGRSAPTLTPLLHPPTTMHLPRSACKQPDARCCCLVQLGEGAGSWSWRGISHPSVPSHRASWPCQPSLGEAVKTFSSRGVYGVASNNRYQKPPARKLPFSQGQSLPGQERSAGDASIWVSSSSFLYSLSLSAKYDKATHVWDESSVSLLISLLVV